MNDIFKAISNVGQSITKETYRAANEGLRHVTEDINSIAKAVETGGVLGGVLQTLDVTSLGHQSANLIDTIIPGADLPPALKEGISLGVNLAAGGPGQLLALKDGFDLFNAVSTPAAGKPAAPTAPADKPAAGRMQTPEAPGAARQRSLGNTDAADKMRGAAIYESFAARQSLGGGSVTRTGDTVIIRGTGADDRISVEAQRNGTVKVTINGESTTLTAREAKNIVVVARGGNDNIRVIGLDDVKVLAGTGNDRVYIEGDDAYVVAGAGRDTINVRGDDARVDGGRGRDTIDVRGENSRVRGGAGKDDIHTDGGPELVFRGGPGYLEELKTIRESRPDAGFAFDGFISNDFMDREISGGKGPKGPQDDKLKKLEADLDKAARDIERILNDPNLSFEDMIFLLMRAVIKQSEASVKIELQQEKVGRAQDKSVRNEGRDALQAEFNQATSDLASAKPEAREGIQAKLTEIRGRQEAGGATASDQAEARSERFEELKQSLQKVSEMQQALSNIMNTLHQTSMNAIGNIR